ncbi:hypothetical protein BDB00DRAFT_764252 [Zychaea mexicana]|uniref:uncharacterized protein n=1 Tax=Zychaea mexicana TaxID=64656 RepID=UPI0022FF1A61|nr:uncharacterized protein BDB00DRAFT_764252 [Zychaea mexicana]KAI9493107.1 hypothetical protein BDB00DRAFT_764252 [Zychaea mexicana]
MPLQVIGAGCNRTGTYSLHAALEILGYQTHHGYCLLKDPKHQDPSIWLNALNTPENAREGWEIAYHNYTAAVDWPTAPFYKQLADRYPKSKVILTTRPVESWYSSMENSVFLFVRLRFVKRWLPKHIQLLDELYFRTFLNGALPDPNDESPMYDREYMVKCYDAYVCKVKADIPEDRLLIMSPNDGWEPLCAFLEKPIPDVPFPITNSRLNFADFIIKPMLENHQENMAVRFTAMVLTLWGKRPASQHILKSVFVAVAMCIISQILFPNFDLFSMLKEYIIIMTNIK